MSDLTTTGSREADFVRGELDTTKKLLEYERREKASLEAKLAAAVARGCCDACAGAGGDPDCMCGGSGSAADAVVHLRNEYFAARAELQAAVARAEAATKRAIEQERLRIEEFDYLCDGRIKDDDIRLALVTSNRERDALRADLARVTAHRDDLTAMLVKLFDWSDTSYIHAVMHVENAVRNLRADLAVERADLARVTAERDDLDVRWGAEVGHANKWAAKFRAAESELASARQEAEALRAKVEVMDDMTVKIQSELRGMGTEGDVIGDIVDRALRDLSALSAPAPVPATPVSAIHNVGKPCPVCSGCDVCLGTGRAPHYVPAPVPATPAPDALALLREARHALDSAWSLRPSVDVELVPTAFRPLSVRTLFAKIDAALTGRA